MTRRGLALARRLGLSIALAALVLSLSGDRTSAAGVPANVYGQDPLEVLALSVKPNVFVVLDTSGSMAETPYTRTQYGGDVVISKMYQAKQVLKAVFQANQKKAQFLFGTYRYSSEANTDRNMGTVTGTPNRFVYTTQSWAAGTFPNPACTVDITTCPIPNPSTVTLPVQGPSPSMASTELYVNSLYAFQWIQNSAKIQNNVLVFDEEGGATCTVSVATGFYTSGTATAAAIQAAMNSCSGKSNSYTVTYNTGSYTFTFAKSGPRDFTLQWGNAASTIRGVIKAGTSNAHTSSSWTTPDARVNLLRRTTAQDINETYDPDGASSTLDPVLDKPSPTRAVTTYFMDAQKFWNGETVYVDSSGNACGITDGTATNPPTVSLQRTTDCANGAASADPNNKATFTWGGGKLNGAGGCQGFKSRVPLIACDQVEPPQYDSIGPWLDNQLPLDANGSILGYTEATDGSGVRLTAPSPGGVMASSNTPLAQSINDIRGIFGNLWTTGQTAPALDPISGHRDPKEKTVVIMVTDGLQNCSPFLEGTAQIGSAPYNPTTMTQSDAGALGTAAATQKLYDPAANGTGSGATVNSDGTINGDVASSVTTYVVGFGLGPTDKARLDVIAWGGSGMRQTFQTYGGQDTWTRYPTSAERSRCRTCTDAFLAPDPDTLRKVLQAVIDIGASSGEFSAQQSITESVFEYVDKVAGAEARMPTQRYRGIVPTMIVSSFTLPGFRGQLRAYQNEGGFSKEMWSAGDKLRKLVAYGDPNVVEPSPVPADFCPSTGMCSCPAGRDPVNLLSRLCTLSEAGTRIKRRIYTTDRNGVYTVTPASLIAAGDPPYTASNRVSLWPPDSTAIPGNTANYGALDAAYGLPPDNPTCYLVSPYTNCSQQMFADLQTKYKACKGTNLPNACTGNDAQKLQAARAEARELIIAFMAGAQPIDDGSGTGWKRASSGATAKQLLYAARPWVLADSELATPAVVTPPSLSEPDATPYVAEYQLYRDGAGDSPRPNDDAMIRHGFGLVRPDDDGVTAANVPDTRNELKPVMTVVYAPANDMLHAFRGGPCYSPSSTPGPCAGGGAGESGGEELWGFIPFDQLNALSLRFIHDPQARANHVFMLARGIRFADVFVTGAMTNVDVGGETIPSMKGVWRRVLYFGRGIGGKYVTALDVTAPGPYTASVSQTVPPIPLWSRGNPDTYNGRPLGQTGATLSNDQHDYDAYLTMGETWSMPTVAYVNKDKTNPLYVTSRRADGVDFVIFMGSGYGDPKAAVRQGTTHYTLDALTGDVVAAVDVEDVASTYGLTRTTLSYPNAIVANSVSFNRSAFTSVSAKVFNVNPHPWSFVSARVYVGDVHGRLWKFLTAYPNVALPAADLGADQPVGTAVALLGENIDPLNPDANTMIPNIFVTTGNDSRATGPFRNYSLRDDGVDTDATTSGTEVGTGPAVGVTTYPPVHPQFVRTFDQGDPEGACNYTEEAVFRGTIQPTSAVECSEPLQGGRCNGDLLERVFYGGTRLSTPATKFAPPTPLACGTGEYPCRSQFDSILYALGVKTGQAAYDLNLSGDDAYRVFRDSRIAAIGFQADPGGGGGARLVADEGLIKGTPKPPPVPGIPPTTTSATASVILKREPGQPAPVVQYGSTVCQ